MDQISFQAKGIRSTLQKLNRHYSNVSLFFSSFTQGNTLYLGIYLPITLQIMTSLFEKGKEEL